MSLTATQKFHLKKHIKELSGYKARHTEFITVYIPQGYDMNKIISHLHQEQGTASNIKEIVDLRLSSMAKQEKELKEKEEKIRDGV